MDKWVELLLAALTLLLLGLTAFVGLLGFFIYRELDRLNTTTDSKAAALDRQSLERTENVNSRLARLEQWQDEQRMENLK